jgi:hypothetical protein
MSEEQQTENTTQTTTESTPEWKTIASNFTSETELANGYKNTKAALTQAQQELAALKAAQQQKPEGENPNVMPQFDFSNPSNFFNPESETGFTPELIEHLDKSGAVPKEIATEFGQTIKQAREIIARDRASKWDKVAGFEGSQNHVLNYLQEKYQGQALQERLSDLEHPRLWENALKTTLEEMKASDYKGNGDEPKPLPDAVTTQKSDEKPLDPNSAEFSELYNDERYKTDASFREQVSKRVAAFTAMNR